MQVTSRISQKFLTTIPKQVVKFMGLAVGDDLEYQQRGNSVIIKKKINQRRGSVLRKPEAIKKRQKNENI